MLEQCLTWTLLFNNTFSTTSLLQPELETWGAADSLMFANFYRKIRVKEQVRKSVSTETENSFDSRIKGKVVSIINERLWISGRRGREWTAFQRWQFYSKILHWRLDVCLLSGNLRGFSSVIHMTEYKEAAFESHWWKILLKFRLPLSNYLAKLRESPLTTCILS